MNFCSLASFTDPVDIRPLVTLITGFNFATQPVAVEGFDTEAVKLQVTEAAVAFFSEALDATPPVITYPILGTPGTADWYRSDVAVNWTVTDPESDLTELDRVRPGVGHRRHRRRRLHVHRFVRRRLVHPPDSDHQARRHRTDDHVRR